VSADDGATTACGPLGGACSREGTTCAPAPVGSGWSHELHCSSGKWTELEIAPLPQGRTAPSRTLPKLETSCHVDADCVVTSDEVEDDPPRTYACCPGCTQRAAGAAWEKQFRAACAGSPAPMCPPIGCAQPAVRAVCRSGHCALTAK
jgi:hypothetical protein